MHSLSGTVDIERGIMKSAVFERVISEISKHVPPFRVAVLYHGGEPLMNKRFFEMPRALN
jgi:sulfatase maturation enzyme AslB (radical SAM superfamily)